MICQACKDRSHDNCRGGTWCDCQHKPPEGIRAFKYGMYISPAALDPEGLADLLAEMGSTGREPNGDDVNDPAGHSTMDGE